MAATLRTFIGIAIPASTALRDVLRDLAGLGRAVRVTPPENLHLTIKFLGDTPRGRIDAIDAALRAAVVDIASHSVELAGLGAFPNTARPAVIWAGLQPAEPIKQLAAALDRLLAPLGFIPEPRPFHPHLTLARVKGPAPGVAEVIAANAHAKYGRTSLEVVELLQSELTSQGSRYTSLAKAQLSGGDPASES